MSSLMDPDGANRIVKQRISEWHAERQEDRNASLLEPGREGLRRSLFERGRGIFTAVTHMLSSSRHRLRQKPVELVRPAVIPAQDILKGHLPR